MEHETFGHREILEAMESCRPGSDDLFDPALAPLVEVLTLDANLADRFRQQQHVDAAVASAFRDVAVPDGLAERLLGRLAEAHKEATAEAALVGPMAEIARQGLAPVAAATVTAIAAARQRRVLSRRWLAVAAAALSTAAVFLTAAWVWVEIHHRAAYTPLAVLDEATEFFSGESPRTGSKPGEVSPPDDYPISRGILRSSGSLAGHPRAARRHGGGLRPVRAWRRPGDAVRAFPGRARAAHATAPGAAADDRGVFRGGLARERLALRPRGGWEPRGLPELLAASQRPVNLRTGGGQSHPPRRNWDSPRR